MRISDWSSDVCSSDLAPIAEPRRLDGGDVQAAAQLVDDERGERLPLNVFGDDEQGSTRLNHRFQDREQRMESTELLLVYQDIGILKLDQAPFRVGDEVGRKIATVELHAFDHVQLELDARRFLNKIGRAHV